MFRIPTFQMRFSSSHGHEVGLEEAGADHGSRGPSTPALTPHSTTVLVAHPGLYGVGFPELNLGLKSVSTKQKFPIRVRN